MISSNKLSKTTNLFTFIQLYNQFVLQFSKLKCTVQDLKPGAVMIPIAAAAAVR